MCCQKTPGCWWRFRKDHGLVRRKYPCQQCGWKHDVPLEKTDVPTTCSSENPGNWRWIPISRGFRKKHRCLGKVKNSCVVSTRALHWSRLKSCTSDEGCYYLRESCGSSSINSTAAWCTCHEDAKNSGISIHHTYKDLTFFLTRLTEFRFRAMGEKSPYFMQFS